VPEHRSSLQYLSQYAAGSPYPRPLLIAEITAASAPYVMALVGGAETIPTVSGLSAVYLVIAVVLRRKLGHRLTPSIWALAVGLIPMLLAIGVWLGI
jgi:hypothetical protein